jgi:hypothetical protein
MLNLEKKIEQKIDEIGDNYCENKGIILTESDLKCIVYSELLKIKSLNNLKSTNTKEYSTDVKSHYIHTEISWFDKSGRLTLKPDITILNPHSISIKTDNKRSFIFGDNDDIDSIIFELKFYRNPEVNLDNVKNDYEKFLEINKLNKNIYAYFIIFSRYTIDSKEQFEHTDNNCKFIYKSACFEKNKKD